MELGIDNQYYRSNSIQTATSFKILNDVVDYTRLDPGKNLNYEMNKLSYF